MITITWTATTLGTDFDRYLVSRRRTGDGPFDVIAEIRDQTVTSFQDVEHRWTVEEHYQVQVVNVDGETSLPSATSATKPKTNGGWTVMSNHADLGIDADVLTEVDFEMPDDRQFHVPHGRNFMLATSTGRRRGLHATFDVLVHEQAGNSKYDGWLDRAAADVPYWAVADQRGDRRFMALTLEGASETVDTVGVLTVTAIEVSGVPAPVTI